MGGDHAFGILGGTAAWQHAREGAGTGATPATTDPFGSFLQQNHAPADARPASGSPGAGTPPAQAVLRPDSNTLGQDVLNTLERYGSRVDSLRRMGLQWRRGLGAVGTSGADGAGGAGRSLPVPANIVQPAPGPGGSGAPATMEDISRMYRDSFSEAMSHQADLYNLMIEVDLGRQVASTATSTAKTLLTQSG